MGLEPDRSKMTTEQLAQVEAYDQSQQELATLKKIADDIAKVVNQVQYMSTKSEKGTGDLGAVLLDIRESIDELVDKENPEAPDHAKPVVEALSKLEKTLTKAVGGIKVNPQVNVSAPDAPKVDLRGVEKVLKVDIPKAFDKAIKSFPKTEIPKNDLTPLTEQLSKMSEQLSDIDTGVRLKPQPGSMTISNFPFAAGIDADYLDVQQTDSDTETYVFKINGSTGTVVKTIVVNYTSSAKTDIDNVTWS